MKKVESFVLNIMRRYNLHNQVYYVTIYIKFKLYIRHYLKYKERCRIDIEQ